MAVAEEDIKVRKIPQEKRYLHEQSRSGQYSRSETRTKPVIAR